MKTTKMVGKLLLNSLQLLILVIIIPDTTSFSCYSCTYTDGWGAGYYGCVTNQSIPASDTVLCPPETTGCNAQVQVTVETNTVYYITRGCGSAGIAGCAGASIEACNYNCNGELCNDDSYETDPINATAVTEAPGTYSCYSCVYSYNNAETDDTTCVDAPANVTTNYPYVRCPPTWSCLTFKQWDKGNQYIRSFSRSCVPPQQNNCVEDIYYITYNNYCRTELCNSGDPTCPPPARPPTSSSLMLSNLIPNAVCLIAQITLVLLLVVK